MLQAAEPTVDEIAAGAAAIRSGWSQAEHERRLSGGTDAMVELLAGIMRPMAMEAGLTRRDVIGNADRP